MLLFGVSKIEIIRTLYFLVLCISCNSISAQDNIITWDIILDQERAPFSYQDNDQQIKGLMIDIWQLIGEKSHRKIRFELLDHQHSLHKVRGSNKLIHGAAFKTDEQGKKLLYSDPLFNIRFAIFIHSTRLANAIELADLQKVTLGITAGSYEEIYIRQHHPELDLHIYNNQSQLIEAAVRGDVDAFVTEYLVGNYYLEKITTPGQFRVMGILFKRDIHAAVARGNKLLLDDINQAISLLSEKDLQKVRQKWIAQEAIEVVPKWILSLISMCIGVLILVGWYLHTRRLRRKIQQQAEKILEQEKQVLLLTNNMTDCIWTLDENYRFTYVSPSSEKLLGYTSDKIIGQSIAQFMPPREYERFEAQIASATAKANRGEVIDSLDITYTLDMLHSSGQAVWTETALRIFFNAHSQFTAAQGSSRNISERKQAEDIMRQMAFNDPLTHLPNRRLLIDRIQQAMAGAARHDQYAALLFLDLDNFKYINDRYGHDNGDNLLQQVALRLSGNIRESDTVARFGGDEFVIVSERLSNDLETAKHQALIIGIKTLELFDRSFFINHIECNLTTSIGVALFKGDSRSINALIKQADAAMYQAKAAGRNRVIISETNQDV
jgi:diguanylate cyclase (GGDEF)-like protein/PAS domain S-box-containing protein